MTGYSDRSEGTVFGWPRLATGQHRVVPDGARPDPGIREAVKLLTGYTDEQLDELGGFEGER